MSLFAYGQTGAGKTHTMEGPPGDHGVNYRALEELFHVCEERSENYEYIFTVSMLEIYNETLRDLLVTYVSGHSLTSLWCHFTFPSFFPHSILDVLCIRSGSEGNGESRKFRNKDDERWFH